MKEYVTIKTDGLSSMEGRFSVLSGENPGLTGTEIFCADITPREISLYNTQEELNILAGKLIKGCVKRLHASYWASPSAFLFKMNESELVEHFGSTGAIKEYYSDLTGEHLYKRWIQEYTLAKKINAHAYVFHLIDYFPVDGLWRFVISPKDVVKAMVMMTEKFVGLLYENNLIDEASPKIELENAGWGLEYGVQTWEDYDYLFGRINDPSGRLGISWDINHLLHALGEKDGEGKFFLPEDEISQDMKDLREKYGEEPSLFAEMWIKYNVLNEKTIGKVSSVQLSDCVLKKDEIFTRGYMNPPYRDTLLNLPTWEEKESYGERIVLTHYDSHVPLGNGMLSGKGMKEIIDLLEENNGVISVLHELKNSADLSEDLKTQRNNLYGE